MRSAGTHQVDGFRVLSHAGANENPEALAFLSQSNRFIKCANCAYHVVGTLFGQAVALTSEHAVHTLTGKTVHGQTTDGRGMRESRLLTERS